MQTQEEVKRAYDRDMQRLGQKLYDPAALPVSFDDITPQWLTGTLCRDYAEAEVLDCRMEFVEQGTTNRVRLHVTYDPGGEKAGLPTRLFVQGVAGLGESD